MAMEKSKERVVPNQVAANKLTWSASGGNDGRGKVYKWREASSKFLDAYIDWVRGTAKRVLYPKDEVRSVPVLVSLQPGKTKREFFERLQQASGKLDDNGVGSDLKYEQFTLNMPDEAFERLQGDSSIDQLIHRITIAHKLPRHATREDARPLKPGHNTASGNMSRAKGAPS